MSLTDIFSITGSALSAQSVRLNTTASNLANVDAVAGSAEDVYKARHPIFQSFMVSGDQFSNNNAALGVKVSEIYQSTTEAQVRHQPDHPLADENGNVFLSNVNMIEEMTNMIEASRSYQTNVQLASTAKQLIQQTLRLGQ
jgi:flagellar basal-body rod protein FlgC